MSREDLENRIDYWIKRICELKAEIELITICIRNEKIAINLSEAASNLVKAYNMLLAAFKALREG